MTLPTTDETPRCFVSTAASSAKLLTDAEECALISKLAIDVQKRELFARLAQHLKMLADDVAVAIKAREAEGGT
jgi:hypothetical protein